MSPFASVLADLRESPARAVVVQGEAVITAQQLLQSYEAVRKRLSTAPAGRIALFARRADALMAALLACHEEARHLVLFREPNGPTDAHVQALRLGIILNDDLTVASTHDQELVPRDPAVLIPTSGTTGVPKLAMHQIERLLGRVAKPKGLLRGSRWLLTNHPASFAGLQVILTAMVGGAEIVSTEHGSLDELFDAAMRHRPTHVSGTPTFWRMFLLTLREILSGVPLKQITIGGEAVDQELLDRLRSAFPEARIIHIYASTEAGALFAVTDGRAGFPARWLQDGVEGVRFRIRDGVLETISPRAMHGYVYGTAAAFMKDGWLNTGDLVEVQDDRVLFRGRSDTIINVGGAKVVPEEVERNLMELPFVQDVKVFGKSNPIVGALVHAYVVIGSGITQQEARSQILRHATERLEGHKIPRVLHFVSAIPMNASGKKTAEPCF